MGFDLPGSTKLVIGRALVSVHGCIEAVDVLVFDCAGRVIGFAGFSKTLSTHSRKLEILQT